MLPSVSLSAGPVASEPSGNSYFIVRRTGGSNLVPLVVTLNYPTLGTATSGVDYSSLPVSVTIPIGSDSVQIPITIKDDFEVEADEIIRIAITANVVNYLLGSVQSVDIMILDDDSNL